MSFATRAIDDGANYTGSATVGQREDLTDLIHNIAPTETPVLTAAGSSTASAMKHEWQEDTLEAPEDTPRLEGYEPSTYQGSGTARLSNDCQLTSKAVRVSGDIETVDKAGRDSEIAYQSALRAREMKTDVDFVICSNKVWVASPANNVARTSASLTSYLPNAVPAALDTVPSTFNGTVGWVFHATTDAFIQSNIDTTIQNCWTDGGKPTLIVIGPVQKAKLSLMDGVGGSGTGGVTRSDRAARTIYATADIYVSNFGTLYVVPSRHVERTMPITDDNDVTGARVVHNILLVDPEYVKVAYLRPWQQFDLAKTGDNIRRQLLVRWTLEVCNRNAHGGVLNRTV